MKKILVTAGLLALVAALGLWFFGRPAYRHYKETRALEQAKRFAAKGDLRNASLSARQAYQVNPANLEACRILAETAERSRLPQALDWRRRIVELAPTTENRVTLAATALHAQSSPFPLASQILEELADSAKNVAAYHAVCGELALRSNKALQADKCYAEASRLEPTNQMHQLNLAVLRLHATNSTLAAEARTRLEGLRADPQVGHVALRWLVAETLTLKDLALANQYSSQLVADPKATLEDRLQQLAILKERDPANYRDYLAWLQKSALTNGPDIYPITMWMVGQHLADEALRWHSELPQKLQEDQPAPLARVNCFLAKKDWGGLETYLQKQKWGELEFLRYAFLSQAAAKQQHELVSDTRWRTAMQQGGDRLGALTALLQLSEAWARPQAKEDLLWEIANRFPHERWALVELGRIYVAGGNTRGLNKLYSMVANYDSANLIAKNELTATSLLLKIRLAEAHQAAKELYTQRSDDAVVVSTYAYSLHLQGRNKEGLAALEKLKSQDLEIPAIALYYGLLLTANDQSGKAARYFTLAQQSPLLPEEKELLAAGTGIPQLNQGTGHP
jgi:cytochrome c-type biogenesis protein CcmH/NrfG